MIHAREDYNRIQDPEGLIPEDEPVFLLRGKDNYAPTVIRMWCDMVEDVSEDHALAKHVREFADFMERWQENNATQNPDTPEIEMKKDFSKE